MPPPFSFRCPLDYTTKDIGRDSELLSGVERGKRSTKIPDRALVCPGVLVRRKDVDN